MAHSENYGWFVVGINADGDFDGVVTQDEARAARMFWKLADTHGGNITFYGEDRSLWLDPNTRAVAFGRVDLSSARRKLNKPTPVAELAAEPESA